MISAHTITYSILAGLLVSGLSLSGAIYFMISPGRLRSLLPFIISCTVGILLGHSFLHLIPDAIESRGSAHEILLLTLGGILLFFFLEQYFRSKKKFTVSHRYPGRTVTVGKMTLVGDFIHNFTDGLVIAGSFAVSPNLGIVTTLTIATHEITQEVSDTGTLVYSGYSLKRALVLNFLCSLSCLLGVGLMLLLNGYVLVPVSLIIPVTAGGFIYIAASSLIPFLQHEISGKLNLYHVLSLMLGILLMAGAGHIEHLLI